MLADACVKLSCPMLWKDLRQVPGRGLLNKAATSMQDQHPAWPCQLVNRSADTRQPKVPALICSQWKIRREGSEEYLYRVDIFSLETAKALSRPLLKPGGMLRLALSGRTETSLTKQYRSPREWKAAGVTITFSLSEESRLAM